MQKLRTAQHQSRRLSSSTDTTTIRNDKPSIMGNIASESKKDQALINNSRKSSLLSDKEIEQELISINAEINNIKRHFSEPSISKELKKRLQQRIQDLTAKMAELNKILSDQNRPANLRFGVSLSSNNKKATVYTKKSYGDPI